MISISLTIVAILSILLGLLILLWPKILRLAVGLYFIIAGILSLINIYA